MLRAIALIAGLSILLWSLGLPSLHLANAANLDTIRDTLSDTAPSASSNHDIEYTHTGDGTGVPNGQDIVLDFSDGPFVLSYIGQEDIDLLVDGSNVTSANWSVATTATSITITMDVGSIGAASSTRILIGTNATNEGVPNSQMSNPGAEGSYDINITAGTDSGTTMVAMIDSVTVQATVDTVFTFAVSGVGAGVSVNGETTTGTTSTTSIPFGALSESGGATTTAQLLTVNTNASQGYVVTVQTDGYLESTTGGIIDGFANGGDTDTPADWTTNQPTGDVDDAKTWGHWGFTSDDATTTRDAGDEFDANEFAAASTTPRVVMSHNGPVNGTGTGVGTTYVGYKVQITNLQEAGDDYSTTLTYIATPTF